MINAGALFEKARNSSFQMKKLNFLLHRMIPFNHPHRLKVTKLETDDTRVLIPFIRKNKNHLNGLHACVLATGAEYCSGLVMLQHLGVKDYRLIMKSMDVQYHYQAKMDAVARFGMTKETLESTVIRALKEEGVAAISCDIQVHDIAENHICTVTTHWQIKEWKKVRSPK